MLTTPRLRPPTSTCCRLFPHDRHIFVARSKTLRKRCWQRWLLRHSSPKTGRQEKSKPAHTRSRKQNGPAHSCALSAHLPPYRQSQKRRSDQHPHKFVADPVKSRTDHRIIAEGTERFINSAPNSPSSKINRAVKAPTINRDESVGSRERMKPTRTRPPPNSAINMACGNPGYLPRRSKMRGAANVAMSAARIKAETRPLKGTKTCHRPSSNTPA